MPLMEAKPVDEADSPQRIPFPPLTRSHIIHCSYHYWHPLYRAITPKARLVPLTDPFLSYLRQDGIVLPPEENSRAALADDDSGVYSFSDDSDEEEADPSAEWREVHTQIRETIAELGGKVAPKLNWSAPKDATWISATNDMQCRSANDIYLLLKSSDFVTHDLEHAFDGCDPDAEVATTTTTTEPSSPEIPYHLVLRKYFNLNPSLEFRCFVRNRTLLCMCQRDLNHFDFLFPLRDSLRARIQSFFEEKLKRTFPDPNFVFDVYIPPPHERVWLVDINPWAIRTDPLLFSWMEILDMKDPTGIAEEEESSLEEDVVRLSLHSSKDGPHTHPGSVLETTEAEKAIENDPTFNEAAPSLPEFRLVERDDPEAYAFSTPQFSAHKLPREVVDASRAGPGGMKEFMGQWQDILAKQLQEEQEAGSSDED